MSTHTHTYTVCEHPPEHVTADKLQGGNHPTFVQWCQVCGAVRVGRYDMTQWPRIDWVGDWDEPELRKIVSDGVRRA